MGIFPSYNYNPKKFLMKLGVGFLFCFLVYVFTSIFFFLPWPLLFLARHVTLWVFFWMYIYYFQVGLASRELARFVWLYILPTHTAVAIWPKAKIPWFASWMVKKNCKHKIEKSQEVPILFGSLQHTHWNVVCLFHTKYGENFEGHAARGTLLILLSIFSRASSFMYRSLCFVLCALCFVLGACALCFVLSFAFRALRFAFRVSYFVFRAFMLRFVLRPSIEFSSLTLCSHLCSFTSP